MRALVAQMQQRIASRTTVSQSANAKPDAEHTAVEIARPVNRKNLNIGHRVVARAVPRGRHAEHARHLDPLTVVSVAAADKAKRDVLRRIEILIIRAEHLPGHQYTDRSRID